MCSVILQDENDIIIMIIDTVYMCNSYCYFSGREQDDRLDDCVIIIVIFQEEYKMIDICVICNRYCYFSGRVRDDV